MCNVGVYNLTAPAFSRTNLEVPVDAFVWARMAAALVSKVHPLFESTWWVMQRYVVSCQVLATCVARAQQTEQTCQTKLAILTYTAL